MSSNLSTKEKKVLEYVDGLGEEYTASPVYNNWKRLNDNIMDAVAQQYRPGEQLTRQGMYFAVMRAQRDGWREGAIEIFGQAKPLFTYAPRRGVKVGMSNRVQEIAHEIWTDIDGLLKWHSLWDDAVDYSMAIAYTKYCKYHGEYEAPSVESDVYVDRLEWKQEYGALMDSPDFIRIHPYNYRCAVGGGVPEWEMVEWEWSITELKAMLGDKTYNQAAIKRIIARIEKGEIATESTTHYSHAQTKFGETKPKGRIYAREFWGKLSGCEGFEGNAQEYCVITCEGEILRNTTSMLRIGRKYWRPIKRIRLDPMNDLPYGAHVLAPILPHQRMKNLMLNLAADDLVIRQHLGLAVWPGALMNPNQLMNPEGAREPLMMRGDANVNQIPRFFADQASGVVRDVMSFDTQVTEKDLQISGLPFNFLGFGGGSQGKTATEQNLLASSASRKMKAAILNAQESGLKPIVSDLLGLLLYNNQPADLGLSPEDQFQIFQNNYFDFDTSLTSNSAGQAAAMAQWAGVAMQHMSQIAPAQSPESADHIARFLKDMGRKMGLSSVDMDAYLPDGRAPQAPAPPAPGQPQPPPMHGGMPPDMAQPMPEDMLMEASNVA